MRQFSGGCCIGDLHGAAPASPVRHGRRHVISRDVSMYMAGQGSGENFSVQSPVMCIHEVYSSCIPTALSHALQTLHCQYFCIKRNVILF